MLKNFIFSSCYYWNNKQRQSKMSSYPDGRQLCSDCVQHIILTVDHLLIVAQWVMQQIDLLGFNFKKGSTQVSLISQQRMTDLGYGQAHGLAISTLLLGGFYRDQQHEKAHIHIIYGMPVANLVWVLSHELGHVLISQQQQYFNSQAEEEGFCQLLALLVSQQSKNPQMGQVIAKELHNPDPTYGGELRKAYQHYQQMGFDRYFTAYLK